MIKQFNFYDIYGYLLPGMLLLGLLWMPVGMLTGNWPDQDLSKALFAGVFAYLIGHLIQIAATVLVPSKVKDAAGRLRAPSDYILDKSSKDSLGMAFKTRLADQVAKNFGLDLAVGMDGTGDNETSKTRGAAFFQARAYLIGKKQAGYAEQFEGMYVMMRGLGCSCSLGAAYLAGWLLALHRDPRWMATAMIAVTALTAMLTLTSAWWLHPVPERPLMRTIWLVLFLCGGFWASYLVAPPPAHVFPRFEYILLAGALLSAIAAANFLSSYHSFANTFAGTVWRDFSSSLSMPVTPAGNKPNDEDD